MALICLMLTIPAAACHARVFLRWGAPGQSTSALRQLGGAIVYEAPVTINNGKGDLVLFNFNRPPGELMPEIQNTFGLENFAFAKGNTAVAVARSKGAVIRLVALRLNNADQTLLFKIEQTEEQYKASLTPPESHPATAVPPYPGSTPEFHVKDDNTDASLTISSADAAPETVKDFFRSRLTAAGWTDALAPQDKTQRLLPDQSMAVYIKDRRLCCVMVTPAGPGMSRITLLHKKQGMK